jgi:hypothetical protein
MGGLSIDMLLVRCRPVPRSPLNPKNGMVKAYSRTALRVKLPQGAASRILLTVATMSRQRRVPVARLKEL